MEVKPSALHFDGNCRSPLAIAVCGINLVCVGKAVVGEATMTPAHYYRTQAETIRTLAETVEDPKDRKKFFDVAAAYDRLAMQSAHLTRQSIEMPAQKAG